MTTREAPADDRPMASIAAVWRQYRGWAATSARLRERQSRASVLAGILGLLGAVLATLSSQLPEAGAATTALPWREGLAAASAAAIALAGFIGRELLTPDRETEWSRSRFLAEALKREVWRSLMRVPPYDADPQGALLMERAAALLKNTGLQQLPAHQLNADSKPPPEAETVEDYIEKRIENQIRYYEKRSGEHQSRLQMLQRIAFLLGGAAVLLGLAGVRETSLAAWIPVVTAASGAIVAVIQAGRLKTLVPLYQQTAVQLRFQLARWADGGRHRAGMLQAGEGEGVRLMRNEFIRLCEEIMSRENESWRAEWVTEDATQAMEATVEKR